MENETNVISSLCFPCASALLTEAVVAKNIANPAPISELTNAGNIVTVPDDESAENEVIQAGNINSINSDTDRNGYKAALGFEVAEDGFRLRLQCTDGISWAASELFTWNRIAQILIAANPDIFGDNKEVWHQCFPETLVTLGYNVPDWP